MGTDRATMLDLATLEDPNGMNAKVIEVLAQHNPIVRDAPTFPSNGALGELVTLRSSLPTVNWAMLNKGVTRSKGTFQQRTDTMGMISGLSEVDTRLAKVRSPDAVQNWIWQQDQGFIEAMTQLVAMTMLYGNELTNAQSFTGLAPRLASLNTGLTGSQVHSMGSITSTATSIYVVDWGEMGAHLIHPKEGEGVAGLDTIKRGIQRVTDSAGDPFMAHVTEYAWNVGVTVKDPRRIGRLANIDVADAAIDSPTQGLLIDALDKLLRSMPSPSGFKRVLYADRGTISSYVKQAKRYPTAALDMREYMGEVMPHIWGNPLARLDQVITDEGTVS